MKRLIAVLTAFVLCGLSAYSQVSFGVKGGLAIATQKIEYPPPPAGFESFPEPTQSSVTGFAGGVFLNIGIPVVPISIQPEVLYVMKGVEQNFDGEIFGEKFSSNSVRTLHYIEIPVLAKFTIPIPLPVTPNIFAGPALSFLIGSKERQTASFTGFGGEGNQDTTANDLEYIQKNDFGITFGGGVDFSLLVTKLTLDARYTLGLNNVFKKPDDVKTEDAPSFKTRPLLRASYWRNLLKTDGF